MAAIVQARMSKFGNFNGKNTGSNIYKSIYDLAEEAAAPIVYAHGREITYAVIANSYCGMFCNVSGLNNLIMAHLKLHHIPSVLVDNTSGTGGSAVKVASALADSGDNVLLIGVEKMTTKDSRDSADIISTLLPAWEREAGVTLPSLGGFLVSDYIERWADGVGKETVRNAIAKVAVDSKRTASRNLNAHLSGMGRVTIEEVLASKPVVEPLGMLEFCPVSDGAAALLVVPDAVAGRFNRPVYIKGIGVGSDNPAYTSRADPMRLTAVKDAAIMAYRRSGTSPASIDIIETHGMTSVLPLAQLEAMNLFKEGAAWMAVQEGDGCLYGGKHVDTSGGLLSKGHPIGASGVAQVVEIFSQLRREAGDRQADGRLRNGLGLSMAGFGNSATVTILGLEPGTWPSAMHSPNGGGRAGWAAELGRKRTNVERGIVERSLELSATPRGFPDRYFLNRVRDADGFRAIAMSYERMEEGRSVRIEKQDCGRPVCVKA